MASLGTDVEALVEDRLNSLIHNEGKTHLWQETVEDVVVGSDGSGGGGGGGGGGAGSGACQLGQLQLNRWVVLAHLAPSSRDPPPPPLHLAFTWAGGGELSPPGPPSARSSARPRPPRAVGSASWNSWNSWNSCTFLGVPGLSILDTNEAKDP